MDLHQLSILYYCCIGVGLLLPLLHLLLDVFDFDIDSGAGEGPLPFSLMALALGVLVFGAVGKICLLLGGHWIFSLILGVLFGGAAFWCISRFVIRPLKRNCPTAQGIRDLRWKEGVMQLAARRDFVGTVRVLSYTGSYVTYSASPASWVEEELPVGTPVLIVEVDEETNICTVCPFDSYQKQLRQYKKSFTHTKGGY